jgi:gluconokinase
MGKAKLKFDGLILAIDIGTSSSRTALFDGAAQRIPGTTAQRQYPLSTDLSGQAELDPVVFLEAVCACIADTLRQAKRSGIRQPVDAVGVSCFWHSFLGIDSSGTAVTPIYTWADSRCREDAIGLRKELDEKDVHAATGCMLRTSFWPAKMRWLGRTHARDLRRVALWVSPAEYLQRSFCGSSHCAIGMASGTGLFNQTSLAWDDDILAASGVKASTLPELSDNPCVVQASQPEAFQQLNEARWYPGIGDGAASNLGAGASRPGFAALNFGTSAAVRIMKEGREARVPFGLFCYRVDQKRYLIGGAVSNAGNLRAWALRELNLREEAIEEAMAVRPAASHGLAVLPFLSAERAPTWCENTPSLFAGLTHATTAVDLYIAMMEATFMRIGWIAHLVPDSRRVKVLVSGGMQRSPAHMQKLADAMGRTLYPNEEPEASLRGAAIFALEKEGAVIPRQPLAGAIRPQRKSAERFAQLRNRLQLFEENVDSLWTALHPSI